MNSYKIALLIPCTSKNRPHWKTMKDTYLYQYTLKTFLWSILNKSQSSHPSQDSSPQHEYHVYIGYDEGDHIFSTSLEQLVLKRFESVFPHLHLHFIEFNTSECKQGHLTRMWNILYQKAYKDKCDYFYQCGDDIHFHTKGWVNESIEKLQKNHNIGISGPINNNPRILTQAMFSRRHMEIFGYLFPEKEIKNWCCDDWYNWVYQPTHFFPLTNHYCSNNGGKPRYIINNDVHFLENARENTNRLREETYRLAQKHKKLIQNFNY